ncbi:MAG: hypothetical protein GXY76_08175 [Chloroflexi bacterium]|nr:hypothetical protein [Chloroflexota bacterium]
MTKPEPRNEQEAEFLALLSRLSPQERRAFARQELTRHRLRRRWWIIREGGEARLLK